MATEQSSLQAAFAAEFSRKKVEVEDICFDGELAFALAQAQNEMAEFDGMLDAPKEVKERVERLQKEAEGKKHSFVFQSLGRKAWRDLLAEHPPTDEDRKLGRDHNPETFPQAAAVKCCVEIDGKPQSIDQNLADWLYEVLSDEDAGRLFGACVEANVLGVKVPKAVTATRRRSGRN